MEFAFNGTSVSIIGLLDSSCGKAECYIDGVYREPVDTFSDTPGYRNGVFSGYQLAPGNHTLRLEDFESMSGG
jgi:hypothetical protein